MEASLRRRENGTLTTTGTSQIKVEANWRPKNRLAEIIDLGSAPRMIVMTISPESNALTIENSIRTGAALE
jgi:hypothetical protein